ncbi:glycosyltransferase family 87 protein [Terriglobus albidus]|uniref:glycosyltransferase family 87 protein n=1 Tax=Terriglobus albidus TaxID=1592106 RepID=UPI0021E004BE|nr:glycosyltransferase family 87 protein [Terriglobus albidus]
MPRGPGKYAVFGTYWESGHAAIHGLNPYATYPETGRVDYSLYGGDTATPDVNLNPPVLLPYFQFLAHLTIRRFIVLQIVISALWFAAGTLLIGPGLQGRQVICLLASVPVIGAISSGQIYGLLFFLSALAWYLHQKGWLVWCAACIGLLVAIKPTFLLWPVILFFAGHRKPALLSVTASALFSAAPLLLYGPGVYRDWLAALAHDPHWIDRQNVALVPFFTRLGHTTIGVTAAAVIAAALLAYAWKYRPDFDTASGIGIAAGILCAPLGWYAYVLILAPFFVARRWNWFDTLAASIFFVPLSLGESANGIAYLLPLLLILSHFLRIRPA